MAEGNGHSPEIEMPWLKRVEEGQLERIKNGGKVTTDDLDSGFALGLPSLQNVPLNPELQKAAGEIDKSRGSRK